MIRRSTLTLLATLLSQSAVAAADDDLDGQYVKAGPNLCVVAHGGERGTGVAAGLEGAYTFFRGRTWTGGTAELARDFTGDDDSTRWALGPKLGYLFAGLDVRYAGERNAGETRHGVNLRLRLTVPLGGLYAGVTQLGTGDDAARFVEVGVQFKLGPRIAR